MAPLDSRSELDGHEDGNAARRRWMAVLAKARPAELEDAWSRLRQRPDYEILRAPETGLVMVRGRIGGSGAPFNLGEITMTRCAVRLRAEAGGDPAVGFGHVAGRDKRHAELAAAFDALLQIAPERARIRADVIDRLSAAQRSRKDDAAARAAATKVDFFTMVRG